MKGTLQYILKILVLGIAGENAFVISNPHFVGSPPIPYYSNRAFVPLNFVSSYHPQPSPVYYQTKEPHHLAPVSYQNTKYFSPSQFADYDEPYSAPQVSVYQSRYQTFEPAPPPLPLSQLPPREPSPLSFSPSLPPSSPPPPLRKPPASPSPPSSQKARPPQSSYLPPLKMNIEPSQENFSILRTVLRLPGCEPNGLSPENKDLPTIIIQEEDSPTVHYPDDTNKGYFEDEYPDNYNDDGVQPEEPTPFNFPYQFFEPVRIFAGNPSLQIPPVQPNFDTFVPALKTPITILPSRFPPRIEELIEKIQNYFSTYNQHGIPKPATTTTVTPPVNAVSTDQFDYSAMNNKTNATEQGLQPNLENVQPTMMPNTPYEMATLKTEDATEFDFATQTTATDSNTPPSTEQPTEPALDVTSTDSFFTPESKTNEGEDSPQTTQISVTNDSDLMTTTMVSSESSTDEASEEIAKVEQVTNFAQMDEPEARNSPLDAINNNSSAPEESNINEIAQTENNMIETSESSSTETEMMPSTEDTQTTTDNNNDFSQTYSTVTNEIEDGVDKNLT